MATKATLFLMLPLLLLLLLGSCSCQDVQQKVDGEKHEAAFFIGGIIEKLLKPLKAVLAAQVNSIIQSITDQGGHIVDSVKTRIAAFVELIRPFVIRIIDRINNIVGEGVELRERIRMAIESLFNFLGVITEVNKEIVSTLINYIRDLLFSKMSLEMSLMQSGRQLQTDREVEFLIGGIVEILLRPLKALLANQVNSIIQSITDHGGQIVDQLKSKIDRFVELIRPFVIRLIDRINDIIGAGIDLKERIQMAVENIFNYLNVINEANKEVVRRLIRYVVDKLLGDGSDWKVETTTTTAMSPKLISGIVDWFVKPIVQLVRRQLNSLLLMLMDQAGHAADKLLQHADKIAELIRPSVIRILDLAGNLHGEIDQLTEHVREAVTRIMSNLGAIAGESAELVSLLIEKVTELLVEMIQNATFMSAREAEQFLIIDRIIARILQPLLAKINDILDRIREAVEDTTEEAKQRLLRLINELSLVLKAPVVRIIGLLADIGVEIGDTVAAIRRTLEIIIDSVSGIHEANKQMFKAILESVLQTLLQMVQTDLTQTFNYSILVDIVNRILAPIVAKVNELLDSLRQELEQIVDDIDGVIGVYVERLASLLSPPVSQIVRIMKQLGLGGRDVVENVRRTLEMVIDRVSGIAEANRRLLVRILGDLVQRIAELVRD